MGMAVRVVMALVACVTAAGAQSRPRPAPPVPIGAIERDVVDAVNRHRRARGLPALATDARIGRQARLHSRAMAAGAREFGHRGFEARADTLRDTMTCRRAAENVALQQGYRKAATTAMDGWLASSGHRRNIEGPYEWTGVGVVSDGAGILYLTQIFCGR